MSKSARTDEIDELVSSVRDFVSHKEPQQSRHAKDIDRLVLTADQRISEDDEPETPSFVEEPCDAGLGNVLKLDTAKPSVQANLEATIAELEEAVTAQSDDWEPDEGESFEASAWALSAFRSPMPDSEDGDIDDLEEELDDDFIRQDTAEDDVEHVASADDSSLETDADPEDLDTENMLVGAVKGELDEDAIRELVLGMVQEELTGELGERITRNVRKLVRREINRILASREIQPD